MNDFVGTPPLFGEAPSLPQQIRFNLMEPPEQDPKKAREKKTLEKAGVDPALELEKAKARFLAEKFSETNWVQRHPTLAAKLADRDFVQVARDDLGNLIETEGFVNEVANAWRVSRDTVFAGKIGTRAMLEGRDLYPYERERLKRAQELASAHMASDPGFFAASAELAGTLVETAGVAGVAGGVTSAVFPPAAPYVAGLAAYAASFQLEGGNLYAELLREFEGSITPAQARDIAIGYGSVIAGADLIGLKVATAPIKGLLKEIAKKRSKGLLTREAASRMTLKIVGQGLGGALGEATTEGVQDVLQERAKRVASEIYRPDNLYEPEYEEAFWRAFSHTFKGMVLMAGVPTGARVINRNIQVANANYAYEKAKQAAEIRGRSKSPDAQREVEAAADETDTLNSTYYVRAQDFTRAVSELAEKTDVTEQQVRDTVEANSPGLMAKIDAAAEHDGEVALTKSEWGAAFDNTQFRETALLNTAFEEDGLTQREAKEVDLLRDKIVKEDSDAAAKKLQDLEEFERELREVRKDINSQLREALKGTDAELTLNAAANTSMLLGFIRRAALQMNISPKEFVEKHLPKIVQKRLEGQQRGEAFQAGVGPRIEQVAQFSEDDTLQQDWKDQYGRDVENDEYVYHVTTPERAQAILESGELSPGQQQSMDEGFYKGYSAGKVFLAEKSGVDFWASTVREHLQAQQDEEVGNLVVLRVLWDAVKDQLENDEVGERDSKAGSYFSTNPIQLADSETLFSKEAAAAFDESPYNKKVVAWAKDTFGNRVAPNGKPAYQNFLEFFGDSVVLDEEGRPLVMYHGTRAPGFSEFEYKYLMHGLFGVGIYTTENSKVAGGYAGVDPDAKRPKNDKDGGIYPLLVSIKNPIDMEAEPDLDKWRAAFPDVEFPDGIEKNEYAYRHVEDFYGIRSEAFGWKTRGAAKPFLIATEKRQAPSARDINEGESSSPDILRLATEIRELEKQGNRIHRRQKEKARLLMDDMGFKRNAYATGGFVKKYDKKVEIVSSELLEYSFRRPRDGSDNPNIPTYLDTYKVEYVDPYFGRQTVVVGALDSMDRTLRYAVEADLGQRMLGAFGASIDWDQADNPYSLANGSYPFESMRLEGKALNQVTDAMREAMEAQLELDELAKPLAEKENELEALRLTDEGQDITELVQNGLVRMGHDGITHLGGGRVADERHRVYIAFEPNQVKSFYNMGDFSADPRVLYSKEGEQRRVLGQAEAEGGKAITKILLDPNAKPTTLMHELTHWNLELMAEIGLDIEAKMAQEGYEATALEKQMLDDIQRLLKWSGFEGTLTEWRGMTIDQRREYHEVVAMSFERYLYEGVAPSRELRGVFSRLLAYISGRFKAMVEDFQATYNEIRKKQGKPEQPLPGLNDEVRAIFGRMMSAERDVQAFFEESELDAMMMTKKEWTDSGRDADEYDEYEREFKDALSEATSELTMQRMKEVKTFANAYALVAQKQRGELQRITREIRQEVQAQVEVESVYQFVSWMRKGTYKIKSGTVEPLQQPSSEESKTSRKLNAAIVKAVAPDLYSQLARRGLTSKNGVTLEKVRGMFGFESNRAMLEALANHRNMKEEVLHRTNQRLLNEHTDLMDPIVQQENIHRAVHNKIRQRVVARELKFLLQNGRRSKQEVELAKRIAEAMIEKTPIGNIDIVAYKRAAARARKKALKALKDGDMEAAAFAKRQELVNEQMIVEGLKARKEVRSLIESNKRAFKHRTDKTLAKAGYDVTVMKALRAVLSRLGIGKVDYDANEALTRFVKEDPEFAAEVGGNIASLLSKDIAQPRVGDRRKPMEHLTLADIRALRLLSARMMLRAKNKLTAKIGEKRQRVEAAQSEAVNTLESNVKDGSKDLDGKKSLFGKIRNYFSDLIRFEHLFRRADGGKVGIWTQMFRMVKDAGNRYRQEFKEFAEDFGNRLRALNLEIPGGARELELTVYGNRVVIGENGRNVKSQLIHLAMHYYGNASNRQRLLRGYIGEEIDPELLEDAMEQADLEVKTFLQDQIRQGLLTLKDFEFMQETFDQLSGADMLGRAQQVMMRLRHYEMDTIEGQEFSVEFPDGKTQKFKGGYIPVRYDTSTASVREGDAQGLQDEDMSIDQQAKRMLGILPSFAKDRTGPAALPLELNLANIQHHAAEVYKFIHMAEPVTEVYKVVSGRKVRQSFIRKFGTKAYRNMEGWLRRSAYQKFDKNEDTEVGDMMLTLARNANMGIMFLNIGNALQNYAGLIIPMRRVGARRIISALISNMFTKGARAEVVEKSTEMKIRLERQIFDIYNQQQKLLTQESGVWDRIQDWSNRHAYFLQQWTQNHVDVAVWQAAYNQETEVALREMIGQPDAEAKAEARAVAYADSIVRQTQMAGEKEDLSNFESQGSIYRAMFPFKSWFINWMNNASNQRRLDMDKQGQAKAAALASSYMYLLMLPAMMATAAVEIARGEDFDDDDDGYGDDMWELWWRSQAEQITGGLPVIQEATRVMDTFWFDDEYWNNRYPATPWQRVIENIAKAPLKEDAVDAAGSLVSQFADLMGIPATRVWKSVNLLGDEFIRDELESESTYDFLRGAVTGQRSDLQRLSQ